ncbi:LAMI_0F13080g1_1 [Lachancea mirantina]|uniref:LAMI_0F13080g1_1 n=1 Tax=Lachancea mirantina TaxID=1230905 RepID=A0A1G4K379_9SACH|nr:LAMI_0F13080g1_1 [Lachancea mirantina]
MTSIKRSLEDDSQGKTDLVDHRTYKRQRRRYLDTINLRNLDFDVEKTCSITLSPLNVYCCLVCGRYLQGRSSNTVAFRHSIEEGHHIFVSMATRAFYALPENHEIAQESAHVLKKIDQLIRPSYTQRDIEQYPLKCYDLNDHAFQNGFVGLNNSACPSYVNAILLVLSHIPQVRNVFLLKGTESFELDLIKKIALMVKKIWSPHLLRAHVSPFEISQQLSLESKKIQTVNRIKNPHDFLIWIIHYITSNIPNNELSETLVRDCRGVVEIKTKKIKDVGRDSSRDTKFTEFDGKESSRKTTFWNLSLDLPLMSFLNYENNANDLPQVKLETLLEKFLGQKDVRAADRVSRYKLLEYPKILFILFNRFTKGAKLPIKERNRTIVEFQPELKLDGFTYRLIGNIAHETMSRQKRGEVNQVDEADEVDEESEWKTQLLEPRSQEWFEFGDKEVKPKEKQLLFLSETFVQVWQRS